MSNPPDLPLDVHEMTEVQLRALLRERGLSDDGTRMQLVTRLLETRLNN